MMLFSRDHEVVLKKVNYLSLEEDKVLKMCKTLDFPKKK